VAGRAVLLGQLGSVVGSIASISVLVADEWQHLSVSDRRFCSGGISGSQHQ